MNATKTVYYPTGLHEMDKVLGGGVVCGKTLLLGSDRGVGKTTLLLQACDGFAREGRKAYFASGEMSRDDCLNYAKRLGIANDNVGLSNEADVDEIVEDVQRFGAELLVIDSIQAAFMPNAKGDIGQVAMMAAVADAVTSFARARHVAVIMTGHHTKNGHFPGGARIQRHVDGVIRLDVKDASLRTISMEKSQHGRIGVIEVTNTGFKVPDVRVTR